MKTLYYFFDFLSPFSYFSWGNFHKIRNEAMRSNASEFKVEYYPVMMGKLFLHHQQKGPGEIPPKRDFLFKECLRYAEKEKISFNVPHHLPFNPMLPLRLATVECSGEDQFKIISLLWEAIWVNQIDPEDPDELLKVIKNAGLDGDTYLEKAFSMPVKNALKKNIEFAISKNLFGVPSFLAGSELFWGNDALTSLDNYLQGKDQYDVKKFQEFSEKLK